MQPYLNIQDKEQYPCDIRLFMQKNEDGEWHTVGKAVRRGYKNGLLANLSGGSDTLTFDTWFENIPKKQQVVLLDDVFSITQSVPYYLDERYGPLFELGLDICLAKDGRIWILDINSKPGRKSILHVSPEKKNIYILVLLSGANFYFRCKTRKESFRVNRKRFLIGIDKNSENTLFLPSAMKQDGLLSASFGTKVVRCHVTFRRNLEQTVLLSENLFHELLIPHRSRADILIHDHSVHIGPLIGIFTAGFTASLERPFKDRSLFFLNCSLCMNKQEAIASCSARTKSIGRKGRLKRFYTGKMAGRNTLSRCRTSCMTVCRIEKSRTQLSCRIQKTG